MSEKGKQKLKAYGIAPPQDEADKSVLFADPLIVPCPKCDAQAIDSSDSPVAADMRERVAMMLRDGRADKEILDFMANRFGEFVLYNPRLDGRTWLLWALPAALVAGGAMIVMAFVRARRHRRVRPLSEEERTRLSSLIHRHREGSE